MPTGEGPIIESVEMSNSEYIDKTEAVDIDYKEVTPEPEEEISEEERINNLIDECMSINGYAYIYEGKPVDLSKLSMRSKTFVIYNKVTGLPFIYNGDIVKYTSAIEATAALHTLKMYTCNPSLILLDIESMQGKSML